MTLTKVDDRGLKTPIDLQDNEKIRLGTGNDLEIFHDGSFSYIKDNGTGDLILQGTNNVWLGHTNSEYGVKVTQDAGVELRYDNSKKLETASDGILTSGAIRTNAATSGAASANQATFDFNGQNARLLSYHGNGSSISAFTNPNGGSLTERLKITSTGNVQIPNDSGRLKLGASQDLEIYHNGTDSYIDNHEGDLYIRGDGDDIFLKAVDTKDSLRCIPNGAVELYHNDSKKLETSSNGVNLLGTQQNFEGVVKFDNTSNSGLDMRWEPSSNSLDFVDTVKARFGTGNDLQIYHDGTHSYLYNLTGELKNRAAIWKVVNAANSEIQIKATENAAVELYYDNSKKLETTSSGVSVTGTVTASGISFIPSGTKMLFAQTSAPTGWTKLTNHDNKALRLVSGTAGTGGSSTFTSKFNQSIGTSGGSVASHTLTTSQIPSHYHSIQIRTGVDDNNFSFNNGFSSDNNASGGTFNSNSTGGGQGHSHGFTNPSINFDLAYVDVIYASKD